MSLRNFTKAVVFFFVASAVWLFLEMGLSYYYFTKYSQTLSPLKHTLQLISSYNRMPESFRKPTELKSKWFRIFKPVYQETISDKNPFVQGEGPGYLFHPLVDFTGAHGLYFNQKDLDYFGFRNSEDHYFGDPSHRYIVFTGGSEAAGYAHRVPISTHIQKLLSKKTGMHFRVLNLGMNSYTTSYEMAAYLHLAYHLKPEFVISHTGSNDIGYGRLVPPSFKVLGLFYLKPVEFWKERLYHLEHSYDRPLYVNHRGNRSVTKSFFQNLEKFRQIVESNGGEFIVGIQKAASTNSASMREGADDFGAYMLNDLVKVNLVDRVHSDDSSSLRLARFYVDIISKKINRRALEKPLL